MTASKGKRRNSSKAGAGEPSNYSQLYKSSAAGAPVVVSAGPAEETTIVLKDSNAIDWKGEYSYVLTDLRKLLIVTLALAVGILVLGFFL